MEFLIGLDIGTSSIKGVLMSIDGRIEDCKTKKHNYFTDDGFKVLDAEEFCENCFEVIRELGSGLSCDDKIISLCASGASGNLLFVKDGKAVSPVYGWQNSFDEQIVERNLSLFTNDDI